MANRVLSKKLLKNINVLNTMLASSLALVVFIDILPYFNMDVIITQQEINSAVTNQGDEHIAYQSPPMSDFIIVSEMNAFHPERKVPLANAGDAVTRPEIVLYGTLLLADTAIAYIEDRKNPYSTPGRGNRQKSVKKGDTISGYFLKEIGKDMIVLERGEDKIIVTLQEKKDRNLKNAAAKTDTARNASSASAQSHQQGPLHTQSRPAVPVIIPPRR